MRKTWLYSLMIFAMLAFTVGSTFAQNNDKDDPQPTPDKTSEEDTVAEEPTDEVTIDEGDAPTSVVLPVMVNGEVLTDTFEGSISARLYVFGGSAGDVVTVAMTQQTEDLDPFLVLLGPAGQALAYDDDSGDVHLSALIDGAVLPADGNYFVLATTWETLNGYTATDIEAKGEVAYDLSINGATEPLDNPNYDPARYTIFAGEIQMDEPINGSITQQEPVFYFLFEGTEGEVFDLSIVSESFDTVLHIFGNDGDRLAVNDDSNGTNSIIEGFEVPETGYYLIFATDYWFFEAALGEESNFTDGLFYLSMSSSK